MNQEPLWAGCSQVIPHNINYMYLVLFESPEGESVRCAYADLLLPGALSCDFIYSSLNIPDMVTFLDHWSHF